MVDDKLAVFRTRHAAFVYESFAARKTDRNLEITFTLKLEPDIVFQPQVTIPMLHDVAPALVNNFAFHLGLIECVSYWKAACPRKLLIKAGQLTSQQVQWWHDLFIYGLGEFYYRNQIDFTRADFLQIESSGKSLQHQTGSAKTATGDLVMAGGGKDTVVTLEMLAGLPGRRNAFLLNPARAALEVTKTAGYANPLIVRRTIDPRLLELNRQGYLNGHTPFSAYLAFLGVFAGRLHDYRYIIVSNEKSAAEGSVIFRGLEINHQYSKSLRFERLFREYCQSYLLSDIRYFSFLRPLSELQIACLFSQNADKYAAICSCNVNRGESWCGNCPKCAFVYLALFPFISTVQRERIFGRDFFINPQIQQHIINLVGLGEYKPFDCVGTTEESIAAAGLTIRRYEKEGRTVPEFLQNIKNRLSSNQPGFGNDLEKRLKIDWTDGHFLPPEYARLLKQKLAHM